MVRDLGDRPSTVVSRDVEGGDVLLHYLMEDAGLRVLSDVDAFKKPAVHDHVDTRWDDLDEGQGRTQVEGAVGEPKGEWDYRTGEHHGLVQPLLVEVTGRSPEYVRTGLILGIACAINGLGSIDCSFCVTGDTPAPSVANPAPASKATPRVPIPVVTGGKRRSVIGAYS